MQSSCYNNIMLRFYNTKSRKVEEFKPLNDMQVMMYTCGPTVYNYLHVGNWVAYIRWDILVRTLTAKGYGVKRVMNITDVGHLVSDADDGEDKMQKGARREGKTAWEVAKMYTDDFLVGMNKLNLIEPTYITKATEYIAQQLELVRTLKNKGYTYQIDDGIYFDTSKFKTYAEFAHLDLDELREGARVEFNQQKRNPSDFALWKFSPKGEKRDMEWDTPSDLLQDTTPKKGFPGWHLECSAMAMDKLGETIDIHTGGIDHIPVHHTNEIAQSEAASGKEFANYWIHNNFLLVDGTKVSKSIGNTFELKDLADRNFSPADFRMFVLQSHYRTESNFTWENLQSAKNRLQHWQSIADLRWQANDGDIEADETSDLTVKLLQSEGDIINALEDDMNTPEALKSIDEAFNAAESLGVSDLDIEAIERFLNFIKSILGLDLVKPDISMQLHDLLNQREQARIDKNWKLSDEIRQKLKDANIEVKDTPIGQIWSRI